RLVNWHTACDVASIRLGWNQPGTVIVAHGNEIAMEPTLERSLAAVFGGRPWDPIPAAPAQASPGGTAALVRQAREAWTHSQEALRAGDFARYGAEQKRLEETLRAITGQR